MSTNARKPSLSRSSSPGTDANAPLLVVSKTLVFIAASASKTRHVTRFMTTRQRFILLPSRWAVRSRGASDSGEVALALAVSRPYSDHLNGVQSIGRPPIDEGIARLSLESLIEGSVGRDAGAGRSRS